ncbi:TPX2 (targeting protein for Xklp2) proteinfamily [Striga asiatica]|uniref:TPX2 (Targeting protein for Xklp2) proteinfamily n=1 Tax=Striga asiatica TaxID=4170 RepID=A0A5A7PI55_STRAF|nr:TPX2 (targeting protein for Xklp2) proteinfamily [Striga asiatica]
MDESVKSSSRLVEVSVSFGRFENDVLSWEKWSSFSPNKYLEEVGSLSTPGSVAQKKAYFEAHYKKIAAKKAEEMEQEQSAGPIIRTLNKEDSFENSSEPDSCHGLSNGEKLAEECATAEPNASILNMNKDENNDKLSERDMSRNYNMNSLMDEVNSHEEKKDIIAVVKCESSKVEEADPESNVNDVDESKSEVKAEKDSVSVEPETIPKDSRGVVAKRPAKKSIREQQTSVLKKESSKSSPRNITQKVTPTNKEKSPAVAKKKVASPVTKPLHAAASRYSKPTLMSTTLKPASQSSNKKTNGSPIPKSNDFSVEKGKKITPTSLHMSLSLGPTNSLGGLPITRNSLIMERMGDKDIVKRAFKTFQNRANGSLMADKKPSSVQNASSAVLEPKVTSFRTPTKGKIGFRKDTEKTTTPRSHPGSKSNPLPSGSHKSLGLGRKNTIASSPSTSLKIDEKYEKRKEFLKKLETKSLARVAANAQLGEKVKAAVANEIHQRPMLSR